MLSLSVVVMAYDEAANLEAVVRELHGVVSALPGPRADEIVIVDDGSKDGTGAVADRLAGLLPGVRVVHHEVNRGLGGVYRTGFSEATRDLVTFFPADGQFPATIIQAFYPLMDDHDLVLGYLPRRDSSPLAKGLSAAEKVLYRLLFGPMPRYQGVFMVRCRVLRSLTLHTFGRGWGVVMEMVLRIFRGPYRVKSVPTTLRPRMSGQSKVNNLRTIWTNLKQAVDLRRTLRSLD
ncbi:MAG TPA: glycosyltransferase family 2 protein [Polyangia bacterium]|nr:glycosyltransferase family 2 protein [Polyangia bacterium]